MADKRANKPEAWVDPKAPFEHAGNAQIITVPMREVRECIERGEQIPSVPAEQLKPRGFV